MILAWVWALNIHSFPIVGLGLPYYHGYSDKYYLYISGRRITLFTFITLLYYFIYKCRLYTRLLPFFF